MTELPILRLLQPYTVTAIQRGFQLSVSNKGLRGLKEGRKVLIEEGDLSLGLDLRLEVLQVGKIQSGKSISNACLK